MTAFPDPGFSGPINTLGGATRLKIAPVDRNARRTWQTTPDGADDHIADLKMHIALW